MRRFLLFAVAVPLIVIGQVNADDDAKAIVTKAIAAHGGKDNLEKFKASKSKAKGSISLGGMDLEFTSETTSQLPDKLKVSIKLDIMGQSVAVEQLVNGDKATVSFNGNSIPVEDAQKADLKSALMQQKVLQIYPLLDKDVTLKVIPGVKVGETETVGVSVSGKDIKEIKIFFDKNTHLLAKVERMGKPPMGANDEKQEVFLSEYKDVQGTKRPSKTVITSDGKKFMETVVSEQKLFEKLEDKEFDN